MPSKQYLDHPGINQSKLKKYLENPAKLSEPEPDSEAEHFTEGKLFEDLCFNRSLLWTIIPDQPGIDRRTTKGKEAHAKWEMDCAEITGDKKCTSEQFYRIGKLADTARQLTIYGGGTLGEAIDQGIGIRNQCIFIDDLKCEIDLMLMDQANGVVYVYDLKTTRRAITEFNYEFWDRGYWIQELHYRNLVERYLEKELEWYDSMISFEFIVGSKLDGCARIYNWGISEDWNDYQKYQNFYEKLLDQYREFLNGNKQVPTVIQKIGKIERKPWALTDAYNKLRAWG